MIRAIAVLALASLSLALAAIVVSEAINDTGMSGWAIGGLTLAVVVLGGLTAAIAAV